MKNNVRANMLNSGLLIHVIRACLRSNVRRFSCVRGLVIEPLENMVFYRTSLAILICLVTIGLSEASSSARDTLLPSDISYTGYRVYIRKVTILKQKGEEYLLGMELINTGKRSISFGPGFPARYLQTRFDESLGSLGLTPLGLQIREGLLKSSEKLAVGEWRANLELWVKADAEIEQKKFSKDNFERVASTITRRSPTTSVDQEAAAFPSTGSKPAAKTSSDCIDLTISEMKILQQSKKIATVQLTIANGGTNDFPLKNVNEGLSLTMFVSGSPRISSSSRQIKQINLSERLAMQGKNALANGQSIVLVERLDISEATRYTAVLIGQLDSGQVLEECNETNNEFNTLLFD